MEPTKSPVPKHIAIILDGNRRFAKRLMMKPWQGHEFGAKKLQKLLEWCVEYDIKELTLYAFSIQNFNRPKDEFAYLMNLLKEEANRLLNDDQIMKNGIKIRFIGRLMLFPNDIQEAMQKLMEKTRDNENFSVNIAFGYGGREEILDAVHQLSLDVKDGKLNPKDIDETKFAGYLYMQGEPDLVIRTGGEQRISNFLLWQSSYSEYIFYVEKLWPEFEKEDFLKCINDYKARVRRFGH
ncbi:di-trans,poly-cis-decaprenylcistransferase [Candidatus Woesearchaeota archaeon]|nr:MAG: di-trans,poly-cis-decaprenylcistransferase [Candidatus Woesearchaeota archaeon]